MTDLAARLDALAADLAALRAEATAGEAVPFAAPPDVAAGELITAAWGNSVADWLQLWDPRNEAMWTDYGLRVQAFTAYVSTDASAFTQITFPQPFSANPYSFAFTNADPTTGRDYTYTCRERYPASIFVFCDRAGTPQANSSLAIYTTAIGPR